MPERKVLVGAVAATVAALAFALYWQLAPSDGEPRPLPASRHGAPPPDVLPQPPDWLPRYDGDRDFVAHGSVSRPTAALVRDGDCLYLGSGDRRQLLAFPEGMGRWDDSSGSLLMGALVYRPGDTFDHAPVGTISVPVGREFWSSPPDPSCDAERVVVLFPPVPGAITDPTLLQQMQWRHDAQPVRQALAEVAPHRLAGAWIQSTPDFRVIAWFTGSDEGLDEAHAIAAGALVPVEIRTGARFTSEQLRAAAESAGPTLDPGAVGAAHIEEATGRIVVFVNPESSYAADPGALEAALEARHGGEFEVVVTAVNWRVEALQTAG